MNKRNGSFNSWQAVLSYKSGQYGVGALVVSVILFFVGTGRSSGTIIADAVVLLLIALVLLIVALIKAKRSQTYIAADNSSAPAKYSLESRIIVNPGIRLYDGEECYYKGEAQAYHEKNVVIGRKSSGAGVSYRVAKGLSVHGGGGGSENIRGQVGEKYDGIFYLTNKRVILNAMKYGFDIPIEKLDSANVDPKTGFVFFSEGKSYTVLTKEVHKISSIMSLIEVPDKKTPEPQKQQSGRSYTAELRELKSLLDDGAITEEEYNAKKAQLLNL